jgi:hypothetical protein
MTTPNPHVVYKEASLAEKPKNLKQVQNLKYAINKQKRFAYDEIANVHLMHLTMSFPCQIMTAPDIRIKAVDNVLLKEVLKFCKASKTRVFMQYDTTFNLTGLYVSILSVVHPFLVDSKGSSPPIPLIYHFHERKTQTAHTYFCRFIEEVIK